MRGGARDQLPIRDAAEYTARRSHHGLDHLAVDRIHIFRNLRRGIGDLLGDGVVAIAQALLIARRIAALACRLLDHLRARLRRLEETEAAVPGLHVLATYDRAGGSARQ